MYALQPTTHLAVAGAKLAKEPQPCIVHEAATTPCCGWRRWLGAGSGDVPPSVHNDVDVVLLAAESGDSW